MWKKHQKKIEKILESRDLNQIDNILSEHQIKLGFLQHERLVHLIVTMTVAICASIFVAVTIVTGMAMLLIPDFMLSILLVAYLMHYRYLENTTQKWYELNDILSRFKIDHLFDETKSKE